MKKILSVFYFILMLFGMLLILSGLGNVFFNEQGVGFDFWVGVGSLIVGSGINYFYWFKKNRTA